MTKHPSSHIKREKAEDGKEVFVCPWCKPERPWYPWEFPRHLEKAHDLPKEAYTLRKQLIPGCNVAFEKEYRENLEKEVIYEKEEDIELDNRTKKFKKTVEQQKRIVQQAERDGY